MKIAPSVLTADFTNLEQELDSIDTADYIHIDIMDGHFVPNISFGPAITKSIAKVSNVPLDIHLMVSNPLQWVSQFCFDQTEFITVHAESNQFLEAMNLIISMKKKVGLSIKPQTPIDLIIPYLNQVDLVLVMTVEPGFGGQSFMVDMMEKVKKLIEIKTEKGYDFVIEIDGGVNDQTIKIAKDCGVDMCVVGSYLFNLKQRNKAMELLR